MSVPTLGRDCSLSSEKFYATVRERERERARAARLSSRDLKVILLRGLKKCYYEALTHAIMRLKTYYDEEAFSHTTMRPEDILLCGLKTHCYAASTNPNMRP